MRSKQYWVYLLTNASRRVLYTGVTNDLPRRLSEHRSGKASHFTKKYKATLLVYAESTNDVEAAITREKQIKGWLRIKKNALVETLNPEWKDLAKEWNLIEDVSS